jgi:hypothetical protein
MKKYLVIYHSTKKIECITILWWVLVLLFVHLTSRLISIFSCTFYHDFTRINVFLHSKKGLGKKDKERSQCDKIPIHLKKFRPSSFLSTSTITLISSHFLSESTLKGGQKCCHIIFFPGVSMFELQPW